MMSQNAIKRVCLCVKAASVKHAFDRCYCRVGAPDQD